MHFSPLAVTDEVLKFIGANSLELAAIDIRGCVEVKTISQLLDARAERWNAEVANTAVIASPLKRILVLPRYSGINENTIEECQALYPGMFEILMV